MLVRCFLSEPPLTIERFGGTRTVAEGQLKVTKKVLAAGLAAVREQTAAQARPLQSPRPLPPPPVIGQQHARV